jgi:phenylacetate-coenzyme A ligase PaaK-like adenylate-forming protein
LWGGRFKDLLECQGTRFQVGELEGVLRGIEAMREPSLEYQIVKPDGSDAPLVVKVEVASEDPGICEGARAQGEADIRQTLGITAAIQILRRDTIPRAGYKATRVIDPE